MHIIPGILFHLVIVTIILWDAGVFHHRSHIISRKSAAYRLFMWVWLALGFNYYILHSKGVPKAVEFLTIYLIEGSLSMDNIFIFILLFDAFKIPLNSRHRVLSWGVMGAILMRCCLVYWGSDLGSSVTWLNYVLGGILIFGAYKMVKKSHLQDQRIFLMKTLLSKWRPTTPDFHQDKFWIKQNGKRYFTPMMLALIAIEGADLIFALDSIPAALAISPDPFIIYTANVFAALGLRSLYFLIYDMMGRFYYLKYSLAIILGFIGLKILLQSVVHLSAFISLGFIFTSIAMGIILSYWKNRLR